MDNVKHLDHYTDGKIEVIDFIEDKNLNYHRGNAVKHIARAGKKDPAKEIEDLRKAEWYIIREIDRLRQMLTPPEPKIDMWRMSINKMLDAEDKPVEPWGEKDEARKKRISKCRSVSHCEVCKLSIMNNNSGSLCFDWCAAHPAEARKIMDEMEGKDER